MRPAPAGMAALTPKQFADEALVMSLTAKHDD
jgi:hypothetical protein